MTAGSLPRGKKASRDVFSNGAMEMVPVKSERERRIAEKDAKVWADWTATVDAEIVSRFGPDSEVAQMLGLAETPEPVRAPRARGWYMGGVAA